MMLHLLTLEPKWWDGLWTCLIRFLSIFAHKKLWEWKFDNDSRWPARQASTILCSLQSWLQRKGCLFSTCCSSMSHNFDSLWNRHWVPFRSLSPPVVLLLHSYKVLRPERWYSTMSENSRLSAFLTLLFISLEVCFHNRLMLQQTCCFHHTPSVKHFDGAS